MAATLLRLCRSAAMPLPPCCLAAHSLSSLLSPCSLSAVSDEQLVHGECGRRIAIRLRTALATHCADQLETNGWINRNHLYPTIGDGEHISLACEYVQEYGKNETLTSFDTLTHVWNSTVDNGVDWKNAFNFTIPVSQHALVIELDACALSSSWPSAHFRSLVFPPPLLHACVPRRSLLLVQAANVSMPGEVSCALSYNGGTFQFPTLEARREAAAPHWSLRETHAPP